ncbi:NUDIX domain-containing protein [Streptococcus pneumoniae]
MDESILFMKQDSKKPSYPNYFDATASESALLNDSSEIVILREVREETGIQLEARQLVYHHHFVAHEDQCIFNLYWATVDCNKDSITLQEDETTDYIWVSRAELAAFLENTLVIPRQKEYLERLFLKEK